MRFRLNKIVAFILSLLMVMTSIPFGALAEGDAEVPEQVVQIEQDDIISSESGKGDSGQKEPSTPEKGGETSTGATVAENDNSGETPEPKEGESSEHDVSESGKSNNTIPEGENSNSDAGSEDATVVENGTGNEDATDDEEARSEEMEDGDEPDAEEEPLSFFFKGFDSLDRDGAHYVIRNCESEKELYLEAKFETNGTAVFLWETYDTKEKDFILVSDNDTAKEKKLKMIPDDGMLDVKDFLRCVITVEKGNEVLTEYAYFTLESVKMIDSEAKEELSNESEKDTGEEIRAEDESLEAGESIEKGTRNLVDEGDEVRIMGVVLFENGQTLTLDGGTIHCAVTISDASRVDSLKAEIRATVDHGDSSRWINLSREGETDVFSGTYAFDEEDPYSSYYIACIDLEYRDISMTGTTCVSAAYEADEYSVIYTGSANLAKRGGEGPIISAFAVVEDGQTVSPGDTVHVSLTISGAAEISYSYVGLRNTDADNVFLSCEELTSEGDDNYSTIYTFEPEDPNGNYVFEVGAEDVNGYYSSLYPEAYVTLTGGSDDREAPAVSDFHFAEEGLRLTTGDTLHFSVRIEDESEISYAEVLISNGDDYHFINLQPEGNGSLYAGSYTFSGDDENGIWNIEYISTVDSHGNRTHYDGGMIDSIGHCYLNAYPILTAITGTGTVHVQNAFETQLNGALVRAALAGDRVTVHAFCPDGYRLNGGIDIESASGTTIEFTDNTFVMPSEAVTIAAVFEEDDSVPFPYMLQGLSVEKTSYAYGETLKLQFKITGGKVWWCDVAVGRKGNEYSDHTFEASLNESTGFWTVEQKLGNVLDPGNQMIYYIYFSSDDGQFRFVENSLYNEGYEGASYCIEKFMDLSAGDFMLKGIKPDVDYRITDFQKEEGNCVAGGSMQVRCKVNSADVERVVFWYEQPGTQNYLTSGTGQFNAETGFFEAEIYADIPGFWKLLAIDIEDKYGNRGGVTSSDEEYLFNDTTYHADLSAGDFTAEDGFTVYFIGNGADSGSMPEMPCLQGTTYTLPANQFIKEGCAFLGWNTKRDGSGTYYADSARIKDAGNEDHMLLLFAMWSESGQTIKYVLNGGTNDPENPMTFTQDTPTFELHDPMREGYRFGGWFKDKSFKVRITQVVQGTKGNLTVYAKWIPITYEVAFDANGGTGTMKLQKHTYDKYIVLTDCAFKRVGHTMIGWGLEPDAEEAVYRNKEQVKNLAHEQGARITLYALWKGIEYAVVYNANGGKGNMSDVGGSCTYGKEYYVAECGYERPGYVFVGWSLKKDNKGKADYQPGDLFSNLISTAGKTVTLYAVWSPLGYTVVFDGNGADTGTMDSMACVAGKETALKANAYKRTGYTFKGWNTQADGTGSAYKDKAKITSPGRMIEEGESVTLYAQWIVKNYSLIYKYVTRGDANDNPTRYTVEDLPLILQNAGREGCTFLGWYTDAKFKQSIETIQLDNFGNKTLYAKWNIPAYTIAFDANGGTGQMKSVSCKGGQTIELTGNTFKRAGYTFSGWSLEPDGEVVYADKEKVSSLTMENGAVIILYAQWNASIYTIQYMNVPAEIAKTNPNPTQYSVEELPINLAALETPGFEGWYSDAKLSKPVQGIKAGTIGKLVFYAKWSGTKYTLAFDANTGGAAYTGSMASQPNKESGKTYALPANTFKWTNHTFREWNTQSDGSGERYANKSKVNFVLEEPGTVTLHAQWDIASWKIVYKNVTAKDNNPNPQTYAFGESFDLEPLSREGSTFEGWFLDTKLTAPVTSFNAYGKYTGDKTVYAKWKVHTYNIRYDANQSHVMGTVKGTMKPQLMCQAGKVYTLTKNTFSVPGYTFLGWNTDPNATDILYANKAKVTNLDITEEKNEVTLFAIWSPNEYTISYKNITDATMPSIRTYTVADSFELEEPMRAGSIFEGWYTTSSFKSGTKVERIETGTTGNKVFYAKWRLRSIMDGPSNQTQIRVFVEWEDIGAAVNRPESVELTLYKAVADGEPIEVETVTVPASNSIMKAWKDLPVFEGEEQITYSVREQLPDWCEFVSNEGNSVQAECDTIGVVTIVNSYTPKRMSLTVTVSWEDEDAQTRPENVQMMLYKNFEDGTSALVDRVVVPTESGEVKNWTDLPVFDGKNRITYSVEQNLPEWCDYAAQSGDSIIAETGITGTIHVTNVYAPKKTSLSVVVNWEDEAQSTERPDNAIITLYKTFESHEPIPVDSVLVPQENGIVKTWDNLPVFEGTSRITYTVQEALPEGSDYNAVIGEGYLAQDGGSGIIVVTNQFSWGNLWENYDYDAYVYYSGDDEENMVRKVSMTVHGLANGSSLTRPLFSSTYNGDQIAYLDIDDSAFEGVLQFTEPPLFPESIYSIYIGCAAFKNCSNMVGDITVFPNIATQYDSFQGCTGIQRLFIEGDFGLYPETPTIYFPDCNLIAPFWYTVQDDGLTVEAYIGGTSARDNYSGDPAWAYESDASEIHVPARINDLPVVRVNGEITFLCDHVTIAEGITEVVGTISSDVFDCGGLPRSITYLPSIWSRSSTVIIPDSVLRIGAIEGREGTHPAELLLENNGYNLSIKSLTLPRHLISIEQIKCSNLETVFFPDTMTSFPVMKSCEKLKSVRVPRGVTRLEDQTFYKCDELQSVTLPKGLTSIGDRAFFDCYKLGTIVLPSSLQTIGEDAFRFCSSLKTIQVPPQVTVIPSSVFYSCSKLVSVNLPEGLLELNTNAFDECPGLNFLIIPSTVEEIIGTSIEFHPQQGSSSITKNLVYVYRNSAAHSWAESNGQPYEFTFGSGISYGGQYGLPSGELPFGETYSFGGYCTMDVPILSWRVTITDSESMQIVQQITGEGGSRFFAFALLNGEVNVDTLPVGSYELDLEVLLEGAEDYAHIATTAFTIIPSLPGVSFRGGAALPSGVYPKGKTYDAEGFLHANRLIEQISYDVIDKENNLVVSDAMYPNSMEISMNELLSQLHMETLVPDKYTIRLYMTLEGVISMIAEERFLIFDYDDSLNEEMAAQLVNWSQNENNKYVFIRNGHFDHYQDYLETIDWWDELCILVTNYSDIARDTVIDFLDGGIVAGSSAFARKLYKKAIIKMMENLNEGGSIYEFSYTSFEKFMRQRGKDISTLGSIHIDELSNELDAWIDESWIEIANSVDENQLPMMATILTVARASREDYLSSIKKEFKSISETIEVVDLGKDAVNLIASALTDYDKGVTALMSLSDAFGSTASPDFLSALQEVIDEYDSGASQVLAWFRAKIEKEVSNRGMNYFIQDVYLKLSDSVIREVFDNAAPDSVLTYRIVKFAIDLAAKEVLNMDEVSEEALDFLTSMNLMLECRKAYEAAFDTVRQSVLDGNTSSEILLQLYFAFEATKYATGEMYAFLADKALEDDDFDYFIQMRDLRDEARNMEIQ